MNPIIELQKQANIEKAKMKIMGEKLVPYFEEKGFRLYLGDALSFLDRLPEASFDMIFADPPYMLSNDGFTVQSGKMVSVNKGKWDKSQGFEQDFLFHNLWIEKCSGTKI